VDSAVEKMNITIRTASRVFAKQASFTMFQQSPVGVHLMKFKLTMLANA
jgi:hypothetical protein